MHFTKLHRSLFIGQSYFNNDGAQLCLILQNFYYALERDAGKVLSWKSKGLSAKNLLLLPLQIIVFLHQLNGTKIQIFVYYLTEKHHFYSFKHNKFFIVYEQDIWSLLL